MFEWDGTHLVLSPCVRELFKSLPTTESTWFCHSTSRNALHPAGVVQRLFRDLDRGLSLESSFCRLEFHTLCHFWAAQSEGLFPHLSCPHRYGETEALFFWVKLSLHPETTMYVHLFPCSHAVEIAEVGCSSGRSPPLPPSLCASIAADGSLQKMGQ